MKTLVLVIVAVAVSGSTLAAQRPPATPPPVAGVSQPTTLAVQEQDARQIREQLQQLMSRYPPDLGRILRMDPTMLQNQAYLAQYPALASFLATHPQVIHNPGYYLEFVRDAVYRIENADPQTQAVRMWRDLMEGLAVFTAIGFFSSLFVWLVKTILDHRRWLRLSRVQTEVHNKLLERFAGTNELISYVQSPAGKRFLEAAPIALDSGRGAMSAPLNRILWSVQAGVILAIGGLGFQFVSGRVIKEVAEGLWMIGVLAMAFGIGFILSGVLSYILSRRLGLLDRPPVVASERGDSTAL